MPVCHLRHELSSGLSECLPGVATSVGTVSHRLLDHNAGIRLRLFDQLQRPFVVGGVARQDIHCRDQLALGINRDLCLMPIKRLGGTLGRPLPGQ
jgi:hypothetical protein